MKWYKASDFSAELTAFARCVTGRLDLVHFLDGEHGGQFLPRLLRTLRSSVRTVATFHQPPEVLDQILDPRILPYLDHIVLMSPSQRSYFQAHVADSRLSVILHGVDTDFFHPAPQAGPQGRLRCVTAGHWLRDWRVFRAVAERLPHVDFHVVTPRDTGAEDLPNVRRHVGVDDETLAELYRSADVLFLPLQDSTANNALLEGMASGLPILTSDLPAVHAYLGGAEALLAPVGDCDAAFAALQRLEQDSELRRRLGASARARAEALSWPRVAAQHTDLYIGVRRGT